MADVGRSASLDIIVDSTRATRGAREVRSGIKGIGDSARQSTSLVRKMTNAFLALGGTIAFTVVTKKANDFEEALREVSTLVDTAVFDMGRLEKAAEKLSVTLGLDQIDLVKAQYDIISAGASSTAETLEMMTVSTQLATGGVTTAAIATDLLTSSVNAYRKEGLSAIEVSDILFQTVKKGKTTVERLAASFGQVGALASTAGIRFAELNASIATMTTGGVKTAQTMTQLKAVINAILRPTDDAIKVSERLGLQFSVAALEAEGFAKFLSEIQHKTGGNKILLSSLFSSVEGISGFLNVAGDNFGKFTEILESYNDVAGNTQEATDKMVAGSSAYKKVMSLLRVELTEVGQNVNLVVVPVLQAVLDNFDRMRPVIIGVGKAMLVLYSIWAVTAFLAVHIILQRLTISFYQLLWAKRSVIKAAWRWVVAESAFSRVWKFLARDLRKFYLLMLTNPYTIVAGAVLILIGVLIKFRKVITPFGSAKGGLFDFMEGFGKAIIWQIGEIKNGIMSFMEWLNNLSITVGIGTREGESPWEGRGRYLPANQRSVDMLDRSYELDRYELDRRESKRISDVMHTGENFESVDDAFKHYAYQAFIGVPIQGIKDWLDLIFVKPEELLRKYSPGYAELDDEFRRHQVGIENVMLSWPRKFMQKWEIESQKAFRSSIKNRAELFPTRGESLRNYDAKVEMEKLLLQQHGMIWSEENAHDVGSPMMYREFVADMEKRIGMIGLKDHDKGLAKHLDSVTERAKEDVYLKGDFGDGKLAHIQELAKLEYWIGNADKLMKPMITKKEQFDRLLEEIKKTWEGDGFGEFGSLEADRKYMEVKRFHSKQLYGEEFVETSQFQGPVRCLWKGNIRSGRCEYTEKDRH